MPEAPRKADPDLGRTAVEFLYQSMQIDDQWSVRTESGFEWWGWKLRQRVWADQPIEGSDPPITKISLQTDVLRSVPDNDKTYSFLSLLNGIASVNAFVYDPVEERISLRSTAYVHEQNWSWLQRFLASVCAIQAADAHARGTAILDMVDATLDESAHPSSGERDLKDDMLNVLHVYAEEGKAASPFASEDLESLGRIQPAPWLEANMEGADLTAEFPFSGELAAVEAIALEQPLQSSLLRVTGSVRNPQLGFGAGLRMELPVQLEGLDGARRANELNLAEFAGVTFCPLTGAWSGPKCTFESFLPAGMFQRGLLAALIFYQVARAQWVRREFGAVG